MLDLFEVYNGIVIPSTHALMIDPYKSMWARDQEEALKTFAYAEFLLSPKKSNPFFGIDREAKAKIIKKRLWGREDYHSDVFTDLEMIQLVEQYKSDLETCSPSYVTLADAIVTAENTRTYLRDVDLSATTLNGTLVLKPKDVTGALKEIPDIILALQKSRDQVLQEIKENTKSRNNREIGTFER